MALDKLYYFVIMMHFTLSLYIASMLYVIYTIFVNYNNQYELRRLATTPFSVFFISQSKNYKTLYNEKLYQVRGC